MLVGFVPIAERPTSVSFLGGDEVSVLHSFASIYLYLCTYVHAYGSQTRPKKFKPNPPLQLTRKGKDYRHQWMKLNKVHDLAIEVSITWKFYSHGNTPTGKTITHTQMQGSTIEI
jgi:hypothetical protein